MKSCAGMRLATGTLHACEQDGIAPGPVTIAKGLGGGIPRSEQAFDGQISEAFRKDPAFFSTATPMPGHRMARPPASRCRRVIRRDGLLKKCRCHGWPSERWMERSAVSQPPIHVAIYQGNAGCSLRSNWCRSRHQTAVFGAPQSKLHARVFSSARRLSGDLWSIRWAVGYHRAALKWDHVLAPPFYVSDGNVDVSSSASARHRCGDRTVKSGERGRGMALVERESSW